MRSVGQPGHLSLAPGSRGSQIVLAMLWQTHAEKQRASHYHMDAKLNPSNS